MVHNAPKTTEQWIDLIAHSELPAITSTARMLDKFSNDDKSSLPKLSEAILHDPALSSCLLRVANNVQHIGVNKVTTVSRATVVLGIQSVKNICLTAKLVESLLESETLDEQVYQELTQLIANSFYAGMLAKMMVPHYSDEVQEEVYLAAMLYQIGETAFWSVGGEQAAALALRKKSDPNGFNQDYRNVIGVSFSELTKGLAKTWNLSDLLIKALDQPETRTDEIKIIYFADKLSAIIASPGDREEEYYRLLDNMADVLNISVRQLKVRIEHTREQACELLDSYGAAILAKKINTLPSAIDFSANTLETLQSGKASKEKQLLNTFMRLTSLMKSSKDLNEYIQVALSDASVAFGFERCSFLMLIDDKTQVRSRFVYGLHAQKQPLKIKLHLKQSDNVIARVLSSKQPALINDTTHEHWRELITGELNHFINGGVLAVIPVKISGKVIGVICGQYFKANQQISTEAFRQFSALIEHLNMCLTMIMRH